jgi:hypothetical protein
VLKFKRKFRRQRVKNKGANNLLQQIYLRDFTVHIRLYALVAARRKCISWSSAKKKDGQLL